MSIAAGVHRSTITNRLLVVEAGVLRNHIAGEAAASDEVQYKKPTDDCRCSPPVNCVVFAAMHDVCDWEKPPPGSKTTAPLPPLSPVDDAAAVRFYEGKWSPVLVDSSVKVVVVFVGIVAPP
ncbi:unnamed protein product [Lactuca virosa]|uniref:Uncharacterized protein n=1 Tax=Lactuca virosa TaxID=75947 RepID=A0AAU9NL20_9ASTR|nr:unnamed protein product [Lactuca virosa]